MGERKTLEEAVSVVGIAEAKAVEKTVGIVTEQEPPEVRIGLRADMEDLRKRLKEFIARSVAFGLNTPLQSVVAGVVKKTGLVDEKWVNYTTVQVENNLWKEFFKKIPKSERVLFIPHCLRDAKNCIAPIDEDGYHCKKCGKCTIAKITAEAERQGIKWYMCGGGSQVVNIIQRIKPKAIIGIACFNEIQMANDKLRQYKVPMQAVLLRKSGCVGTEVDLDDVYAALGA